MQLVKFCELFRAKSPANLRMPGKRARAGAGSVHKDAIESVAKGERLFRIEFDKARAAEPQSRELRSHRFQPVSVAVRRDDDAFASRGAYQRWRLSARGGT